VQNHGDFIRTGEDLLSLINAVDSPWCGPIVDTGQFRTKDPFADIALVAPHAVNWQIKQSMLSESGDLPMDLIKLMTIVHKSGYRGFLPIETIAPSGQNYDPFKTVPAFLAQVRDALAQTA
jgi:sugar phosphate isomerase/epimerase